jgi:hypothetical protein
MIRAGNTSAGRQCGKSVPNEKIVEKVGVFFNSKKRPSEHHNLPRFHHNFTIKKPHSTTRFSQNTPQKRPQRARNTPSGQRQNFFAAKAN